MSGAGGTRGGVGTFLVGLGLTVAGGYMIMSRLTVWSSIGSFWGFNSFGLSLIPLLAGIAVLFYDGASKLGWLLLLAGLVVIFSGVLMNLQVYLAPTSLFSTIMMFGLLLGGLGLILRAVRDQA
jgi:hypothetical protein